MTRLIGQIAIFLFFTTTYSQVNMSFPENTGYDVNSIKEYLDNSIDPFEGIYSYSNGDLQAGLAIIKNENDSYIEISLSGYTKSYIDPETCDLVNFRNVKIGDIDGYAKGDTSFENINGNILIWESFSNKLLNSSFSEISMTKYKVKFSSDFKTALVKDITAIPDSYGECLSPKEWNDNGGRNSDYNLYKIYPKKIISKKPEKNNIKPVISSQWSGNGSGLIISKLGHIVTNYHVIEEASSIEIEYKNDQGIKKYKATVSVSDKSNDLAILKITDDNFNGFDSTPNYNFDTDVLDVGSKVYGYGYPLALNLMGKDIKVTDGIINSKTGLKGDVKSYQISNPLQPGNSGGPLFDEDGTFVGVISSGLKKEIADNVGYTTKSSYVTNLISSLPEKIENPYSYTIKFLSTEKQIKRLSEYVVLIKVK